MKLKKKKYIGYCDNPEIDKHAMGSTFVYHPIITNGDFSRNGAPHLKNDAEINIWDYPDLSYEVNKILFPKKI